MKTFIASLIIFAVLCICVFANAHVSHGVFARLNEMALALPENEAEFHHLREECALCMEELAHFWEEKRAFLTLSVSEAELAETDSCLVGLCAAYERENLDDFMIFRAKFCDETKKLATLCTLNIKSFF